MKRLVVCCVLLMAGSVLATDDEPSGLAYRDVRDKLRVRIDNPGGYADVSLSRADLDGTRSVLLVEEAGGVLPVTAADAARWKIAAEELFDLGLQNVEQRHPPQQRESVEIGGEKIVLLYGDHRYAASYALRLQHYPKCLGQRGSLVAVPNQQGTLCYPIDDRRAQKGLLLMLNMAKQIQEDGDYPLTTLVYWWHDGTFLPLLSAGDGDEFSLDLPAEFEQMLAQLPERRRRTDPRKRLR